MKFRPAPLLLPALLCLGLAAASPATAGPLKSIGSGLKKVGNALTPWKKSEPAPAPAPTAKPAKAASKPKVVAKAAPSKAKAKPTVVAQKKKSSAPLASSSRKKSAAASAGVATAGAAGATGPETPNDPAKDAATTSDTTAAADTPPATVESSAAPIPLADLPFGTPIMGKKGYVRSPFAPEDGLVDVTDIAAGTKVKCPFSGKVFRVP